MSIKNWIMPRMALTSEENCCSDPYVEDGWCNECETNVDDLPTVITVRICGITDTNHLALCT